MKEVDEMSLEELKELRDNVDSKIIELEPEEVKSTGGCTSVETE